MDENHEETQELIKTRDLLKGVLIGGCFLWIAMLVAAIYFYSKTNNMALGVPVFSLIVVFFPIYQRMKKLDVEIKSV